MLEKQLKAHIGRSKSSSSSMSRNSSLAKKVQKNSTTRSATSADLGKHESHQSFRKNQRTRSKRTSLFSKEKETSEDDDY